MRRKTRIHDGSAIGPKPRTGRARTIVIKPASGITPDINVTPLVDVVLVLLIIFMVVTPLLEKNIGVRVPALERVEQAAQVPAEQLVVHVDAAGEIAIDHEKVARTDYVARLRAILEKRPPNDRVVFMAADDATNYGRLLAVIDGAREAGAETIGIATQGP